MWSVTTTGPQPPARDGLGRAEDDVEAPREHQGDTEDVGAERRGQDVEGADEAPPW
jgi:hypothetical protein